MSFTRNTVIAAGAALAALLMTGSSFASTFEAIYTVSIHSQATKHSSVVDKLYEGEHVKINNCDDDWCLIIHDGPDGWVPVASLERIGGGVSYGGGDATVIIGGGFGYPHPTQPPVVVDPGPKKPPFGPIVGQLPVRGLLPISGGNSGNGGNGGNGGGNGGSGVTGGTNTNYCLVNPQLCANHKPL